LHHTDRVSDQLLNALPIATTSILDKGEKVQLISQRQRRLKAPRY
jgi:hypothetical protein